MVLVRRNREEIENLVGNWLVDINSAWKFNL